MCIVFLYHIRYLVGMTEVYLKTKEIKRILQWFSLGAKKTEMTQTDSRLARKLEVMLEEEEELDKDIEVD